MCFAFYISTCLSMIYYSQTLAAADPMWNVNDLVNDVKAKPIGELASELTRKAAGEFDKLYHQLEGVLGQLTGSWGTQEAEAQLDPAMLSECSCYCRCPHKHGDIAVDSKVVAEVRDSVLQLRDKVESVGKALKDKIHEITAR